MVISAIHAMRNNWKIIGLIDETLAEGQKRYGYEIRHESRWFSLDNFNCFIAIGDASVRERIAAKQYPFVNVIHPTVRTRTPFCKGTYFGENCVVGNNSVVGNFSIINTGVILEHDSSVGDFSHLCPGVVTGGRVHIGDRTTIGLNASIRDGVQIGNNCVIGMGSVVLKDVPNNTTGWGNPFTAPVCARGCANWCDDSTAL